MEELAKEYLQKGRYKEYLECVYEMYKKDETPRNRDLYSSAQKMYQSYQDVAKFKKKNMSDPYSLLDVSKDATTDEIKKSYRSLVLKFHPDRSLIPESGEVLQAIMDAYNTLVDPQKRASYDAGGKRFGGDSRDFEVEDFFFGGQRYQSRSVFENEFDFYKFIYNLDHMSRINSIYRSRTSRREHEVEPLAYIKALVVILLFVFIVIIIN